ncbi:MAG TPA: hypothetical protein VGD77_00790 [Gemmatimonadaceae bacterium]
MGASTRIATVAGLLLGLSGVARAQSATLFASATVVSPQVADLPLRAAADLRQGVGGRSELSVDVTMPSAREYQVELRVERAADGTPGGRQELVARSRATAVRGGRGEVEVPLSQAVVADLPEGQARARCTIYYGLDGSR